MFGAQFYSETPIGKTKLVKIIFLLLLDEFFEIHLRYVFFIKT